jgi:hypothetical protein
LDAVEAQLETARRETERVTAHALDDGQDLALAAQLVRQWMFIEKFAEDVYAARDRFAD